MGRTQKYEKSHWFINSDCVNFVKGPSFFNIHLNPFFCLPVIHNSLWKIMIYCWIFRKMTIFIYLFLKNNFQLPEFCLPVIQICLRKILIHYFQSKFRLLEFRGEDPVFPDSEWISAPVKKGDLVLIHGKVTYILLLS